jgi:hypothetical protein
MFYEGARFHQQRFSEYGERLADLADWFGRASRSLWSGTTRPGGISRSARREWLSCTRPHL